MGKIRAIGTIFEEVIRFDTKISDRDTISAAVTRVFHFAIRSGFHYLPQNITLVFRFTLFTFSACSIKVNKGKK